MQTSHNTIGRRSASGASTGTFRAEADRGAWHRRFFFIGLSWLASFQSWQSLSQASWQITSMETAWITEEKISALPPGLRTGTIADQTEPRHQTIEESTGMGTESNGSPESEQIKRTTSSGISMTSMPLHALGTTKLQNFTASSQN